VSWSAFLDVAVLEQVAEYAFEGAMGSAVHYRSLFKLCSTQRTFSQMV
jgi:hypothetical protein